MEPHRELPEGADDFRPDLNSTPAQYFAEAYRFTARFYCDEMDRISSVKWGEVDDDFFFREYVWVVHATGFSAKAVGKFMPKLVEAYGRWDTCGSQPFDRVFKRVQPVCNNPQKAAAIHKTAALMVSELAKGTWEDFRKEHLATPELLAKLPYVGKVTCFHLGRNIGLLDCVKPDLHLVRMAEHWGFKDCDSMCVEMQRIHESETGQKIPLGIVDLALWYAASSFGTLDIKKDGQR